MSAWWPLASKSVHGERARRVVFETGEGGRIYEIARDGGEADWGRVLVWDHPNHVVFTWHPGRESNTAGTVDVSFTPEESGTLVRLVHSGWEKLGDQAREVRAGYDTGWDEVFGRCYVEAGREYSA
jgi:uncharacterized protein YndB with AHSA1/START domain